MYCKRGSMMWSYVVGGLFVLVGLEAEETKIKEFSPLMSCKKKFPVLMQIIITKAITNMRVHSAALCVRILKFVRKLQEFYSNLKLLVV